MRKNCIDDVAGERALLLNCAMQPPLPFCASLTAKAWQFVNAKAFGQSFGEIVGRLLESFATAECRSLSITASIDFALDRKISH